MLRAEMEQVAKEILAYRCPRYEHLPNIPLYSDQVIDSLKQYTAPFYSDGSEQAITPTMINNYVKQHLITPPVKKRYDKEQIARLDEFTFRIHHADRLYLATVVYEQISGHAISSFLSAAANTLVAIS